MKNKKLMLFVVVSILLLSLFVFTACNNSSESLNTPPTKNYIEQCLKKIPGITEYEFVTEETDPYNKLNKPGWYIEKVYFSYVLVNQENVLGETLLEKGLSAGGSIEVFKTKEDAENRNSYLESFDGTILYAGSHIVCGTCVVRASEELTATQQETLEKNIIFSLKGQSDKIIDTRVSYKVKYYLENLNGGYIFEKEVVLKDFPSVNVKPDLEKFNHYYLNKNKSNISGNVEIDGSLILNAYYKRYTYTISSTFGGEINNPTSYLYGETATLKVSETHLGYCFTGWFLNDKLLSNEKVYQCQINGNIVARFSILPEMRNFSFESTANSCKIIDVKDDTIESITIPEFVTDLSQCNLYFSNLKTLRINATKLNDIKINDSSSWVWGASKPCNIQVIFGSNVTYVPKYLFDCTKNFNITSVTFEDNSMCETIAYGAFYNLETLETVNFGNNSKLKTISSWAFCNCINLREVDFGANSVLEKIGASAFGGCKFTSFYIPKSVQVIGSWAFTPSEKLTIYCEVGKNNVPSGWDSEWYYGFEDSMIEIVWNYKKN